MSETLIFMALLCVALGTLVTLAIISTITVTLFLSYLTTRENTRQEHVHQHNVDGLRRGGHGR